MQKVVILGASGFAKEVYCIFLDFNKVKPQWEVLGFIDDNREKHGKVLCGKSVLGDFSWFQGIDRSEIKVIPGVSSGKIKKIFDERARKLGLVFCTIIHPSVIISPFVDVGDGTVIAGGNIITADIEIGRHVSINMNCTVGHDTVLEDYSNAAPGVHLSGNVLVKEGADLGTGTAVIQGLTIGKWSVIGANASVIKNIPDYVTAVGVPAKVIKEHKPD